MTYDCFECADLYLFSVHVLLHFILCLNIYNKLNIQKLCQQNSRLYGKIIVGTSCNIAHTAVYLCTTYCILYFHTGDFKIIILNFIRYLKHLLIVAYFIFSTNIQFLWGINKINLNLSILLNWMKIVPFLYYVFDYVDNFADVTDTFYNLLTKV